MAITMSRCFFMVFSFSFLLVMRHRSFYQGEASLPLSVRDCTRENIDPRRDFVLASGTMYKRECERISSSLELEARICRLDEEIFVRRWIRRKRARTGHLAHRR
jgi:hypothetical protein